jgi:hypothetical protein
MPKLSFLTLILFTFAKLLSAVFYSLFILFNIKFDHDSFDMNKLEI